MEAAARGPEGPAAKVIIRLALPQQVAELPKVMPAGPDLIGSVQIME